MMKPAALAVVLTIAAATACGSAGTDVSDLSSADLVRRCGQIEFDGDAATPFDVTPADSMVLELLDEAAEMVEFGPLDGLSWHVAARSDDEILVLGQREDQDTYRDVRFVRTDEGWRAAGWGGCYMHYFVPGHRLATWNFPLGERPRPGDTTATILVKEECVGEPPLTAENSKALAVVTGDRITISVIGPSIPPPDPDSYEILACELATSVPKTITLPVPADERPIYDGGAWGHSKRTI